MLAIRMQRTGRKGHTQFRVVVQDSRFSPSSGRVVAYLGSYNPHSKSITIDKDKIATYLSNGAQPSERVARLLKSEGVSLPGWVTETQVKTRTIRNQDKLRRNRPAEEARPEEAAVVEEPADELLSEESQADSPEPAKESEEKSETVETTEVDAQPHAPEETPDADAESTPSTEPKA